MQSVCAMDLGNNVSMIDGRLTNGLRLSSSHPSVDYCGSDWAGQKKIEKHCLKLSFAYCWTLSSKMAAY